MGKTAEAFRTISEVAGELDVPKHVLRFWEGKFPQVRPMKRGGGRRYYRPEDLHLLRGICQLLHAEGYTIKGVQKILREKGVEQVKHVGREVETKAAAKQTASKRGRGTKGRSSRGVPKATMADTVPSSTFCSAVESADARKLIKSSIAELEVCRSVLLDKVARAPAKRTKTPRSRRAAST